MFHVKLLLDYFEDKFMWKALFSAKNIITGVLLGLLMGIITMFFYAVSCSPSHIDLAIGAFIVAFIATYILTWVFTSILFLIMKKRPLTYFAFCFVLSTVVFFVSLFNQGTFFGTPVPNPFILLIALHMTVTLFLIPKIDGHWDWYQVTETTYLGNDVVGTNSYLTKEYTAGTSIKIAGMIVLSLIFAGLLYWNRNFAWLIYFFEGGYSAYMVIRVILAYRSYM